LGITTTSFAEVNIANYTANLPEGANLAFVAKNINQDNIIADYNGQTFMLPASTQKVFTALAAKLALGDSFQFQTALLTNGKVQNGQLNGDLIVRFTGDPD
ncbi:D-alanyl-D-alanine carboxypeptidase, partial [Aggregatibacter actinomycetemcomitans serotype d str. SA3733]